MFMIGLLVLLIGLLMIGIRHHAPPTVPYNEKSFDHDDEIIQRLQHRSMWAWLSFGFEELDHGDYRWTLQDKALKLYDLGPEELTARAQYRGCTIAKFISIELNISETQIDIPSKDEICSMFIVSNITDTFLCDLESALRSQMCGGSNPYSII